MSIGLSWLLALVLSVSMALVVGCSTTSTSIIAHSKEGLRIVKEKSFYVSRAATESGSIATLGQSLAYSTSSSTLARKIEKSLQAAGVTVAESYDSADYVILCAFRSAESSSIFQSEPDLEVLELMVVDKATNSIVIGGSKGCCMSTTEAASEVASVLGSIVRQKISYPPTLMQSDVTQDPCSDAEKQFELDLDQKSWGAIFPGQLFSPKIEDPSATLMVGKDINYLTTYLYCYHNEVSSMKMRRAALGCAGGCLLAVLLNPFTIAMLASP
jgi:hypothetical protein